MRETQQALMLLVEREKERLQIAQAHRVQFEEFRIVIESGHMTDVEKALWQEFLALRRKGWSLVLEDVARELEG